MLISKIFMGLVGNGERGGLDEDRLAKTKRESVSSNARVEKSAGMMKVPV